MNRAIEAVLNERRRQVVEEGWTPEHDDEHNAGEMALAAACYALPEAQRALLSETRSDLRDVGRSAGEPIMVKHESHVPSLWPSSWAGWWWKPKTRRQDLIRAAALLLAEIERIDRADEHDAPHLLSNTGMPPPTGSTLQNKEGAAFDDGQPTLEVPWKYRVCAGVYFGSAALVVASPRSKETCLLVGIGDCLVDSMWAPMVQEVRRVELPEEQVAYVVSLFSESDSLTFLATRFRLAVPDLLSRLQKAFGTAVSAPTEDVAIELITKTGQGTIEPDCTIQTNPQGYPCAA